jgi:hypothetical protein
MWLLRFSQLTWLWRTNNQLTTAMPIEAPMLRIRAMTPDASSSLALDMVTNAMAFRGTKNRPIPAPARELKPPPLFSAMTAEDNRCRAAMLTTQAVLYCAQQQVRSF